MRKVKLWLLTLLMAVGGVESVKAQTDVTDTYITNAGFDNESDFQTSIAVDGSAHRYAVNGWTNEGGTQYSSGGTIGFAKGGKINGASIPSTNSDGTTSGGALAIQVAWASNVFYKQTVTLPAGNYNLIFKVNNVGKNAQFEKDPVMFSFITGNSSFSGNVHSYPVNTWTTQTITFALATESEGTIKIGYKGVSNQGSSATPKLVIDYVKAVYNSNYTETLQSTIDRATILNARANDSDLASAITAAQGVLDGANNTVAYQATIDAAVTTLRSAITTAAAKITLLSGENITFMVENADFESSTPVVGGITTYDYDAATNGTSFSRMQVVEGWTIGENGNAKSSGVFEFGTTPFLGSVGTSYQAPASASATGETKALGIVAVWNSTAQYKQNVTLPSGRYEIEIPIYNTAGTTDFAKNLIGFVENGGTEHLATVKTYATGRWITEKLRFDLNSETSGYLSLGYKAANSGSGAMPHLFIDKLTITYTSAENAYAQTRAEALEIYNSSEYANVVGTEKAALYNIMNPATAPSTVEEYFAAVDNINAAVATFTAAKANYDALVAEIAHAKTLGIDAETADGYAANSESTAATVLASTQTLKVAEYTFITTTYTENSALGTWTEDFAQDLNGEGYVADGETYWNEWGSNTRTAKQTVTLPAGDYAISAIGRGNIGTSGYLYYKLGDAEPVTVDFLMKGNRGRGVETSGAANFAEDGTYNCNGEGFGWEYRFLTFSLAEETTVELGVSATFASDWVSIYAPKLFTTEATVKSVTLNFINNELTNNIPDGKMNSDVLSALNTKKAAAQDASMSNTKEELNTILEELRTAISNANTSIAAYTAANEKLTQMKAIVDATNVYTAEALSNYYTTPKAKYDDSSMTDEEANALVNPNATTGWHAESPAVSQFLISAWDSEINDWAGLHVNTWSAAGDFGETGFAVPLVEYWVGSGTLAAKTMTATVTGLEAGNYKVSADMFIRASALPTGAALQVDNAATATITGVQNGNFYVSKATAYGTVGDNGVLTIKLIVADGNNFDWIGFKNMKYEQVNVDYSELNAAIAQANATNAKIGGGVQALTDAIADAEALLTSLVQDDIDAGVSTLNAAITAAETTIVARKNLAGVAKKATALNAFLAESIETDITAASEYAANAEATASEADNKATALLANFASWQKVTLTNADFDDAEGWNGELIEPGTEEKPYVHAVKGWNQAFTFSSTASQGIAAQYGSAAQNGTNGVAAPAADMYGKSEGGTLHLSSGWSDQARYQQTVTLAPGKYVLYYEGINVNNTNNSLNSNYFGINNLAAGTLEGSDAGYIYSDEKSFTYNEWKATAFNFTLVHTATDATLNVGVIGGTGGSASTPKMWFDNVTLYLVEEFPVAEAADYTALNTAISNAESKVAAATPLGFEKDEFAPYNVAILGETIATAKAINQEVENLKSTITAMQQTVADATDALTANATDVDAIFNGNMAIANGNNPKGWTRSNNAWGQQITGLGEATSNGTAWYYNTDGAWVYGNDGSYTMPLKGNTVYKLSFKYRSQDNNTNNWFKASIRNAAEELIFDTEYPQATEKNWVSVEKIFSLPAAGNYVLHLYNSGNTYLSDVSLVKAEAESITINETETYAVSNTIERYGNVTFNRTLVEGWNGLVLPFDMTVTGIKNKFSATKVKNFTGISYDEAKGVTLNFDNFDSETTVIPAGTPFLVKTNSAGTSYTINGVVLPANGLQNITKTADGNDNIQYTMKGTHAASTNLTNVSFALIQGNTFFYHDGAAQKESSAKAFRAYFENESEEPAAARVSFDFGDDVVTGITELAQPKTAADGTAYDLQGRKVETFKQKGIYIVNGRKVVK